jgi:hypothetical protein
MHCAKFSVTGVNIALRISLYRLHAIGRHPMIERNARRLTMRPV